MWAHCQCCSFVFVFTAIFCYYSIPSILKAYGAMLKASAAMVRLRLYDVLSLLPAETYEGKVTLKFTGENLCVVV